LVAIGDEDEREKDVPHPPMQSTPSEELGRSCVVLSSFGKKKPPPQVHLGTIPHRFLPWIRIIVIPLHFSQNPVEYGAPEWLDTYLW
jgi:hypothetical protein